LFNLNINENIIIESLKEATHLFHGVLTRREKAEATRNALAVMTRYKFLFQLPINIDRNIKNEDVDVIINDYARALNLFGKTEVSVSITINILYLYYKNIEIFIISIKGFQENTRRS